MDYTRPYNLKPHENSLKNIPLMDYPRPYNLKPHSNIVHPEVEAESFEIVPSLV